MVAYRKSKYDGCANSRSYILQSSLSSAMAAFHYLVSSFKVRGAEETEGDLSSIWDIFAEISNLIPKIKGREAGIRLKIQTALYWVALTLQESEILISDCYLSDWFIFPSDCTTSLIFGVEGN